MPSDFNITKAQARTTYNSMDMIWNSSFPKTLKLIKLFTTIIERVITYGAENWTLTAFCRSRNYPEYRAEPSMTEIGRGIRWPGRYPHLQQCFIYDIDVDALISRVDSNTDVGT